MPKQKHECALKVKDTFSSCELSRLRFFIMWFDALILPS